MIPRSRRVQRRCVTGGSALTAPVIVVGNEIDYPSSKPGLFAFYFTLMPFQKA